MGDLQNARAIYAKGFLFFIAGILSAGLLLGDHLEWRTSLLLMLCVWSFFRFYYFAFYVIQHHVDDQFRFSGLIDFAHYCLLSDNDERS